MQDGESDVQEGISSGGRQTVRRKLFQDDDDDMVERRISTGIDDNYNNHLIEEHKMELEEKKKTWNFDFEKEEPVPGRWEWSKVAFESSANSQGRNLENRQIVTISKNQETDSGDATPERHNREKSESDLKEFSKN